MKQFFLIPVLLMGTLMLSSFEKKGVVYKKSPRGLEYAIVRDIPGTVHPAPGNVIELHMIAFVHFPGADSIVLDTRKMYANEPARFKMPELSGKSGDIMEGLTLMTKGDSALFQVPVDTIIAQGNPVPPFLKAGLGQKIVYKVSLVNFMTEAEAEQAAKQAMAKQATIDDGLIKDYLSKNLITAKRTTSGLYYTVETMGTGAPATTSDVASVFYTGMDLKGIPFDSNIDTQFHHGGQAFDYRPGSGRAIKGWEEAIPMFPKGTKATIYLPSGLAYGPPGHPPVIAQNAILVFKIEIRDVKEAPELHQASTDDKLIKEYLAKNHIEALRTSSGMYYKITKPGTGPKPPTGAKVSVNYTGMRLDGVHFDSNTEAQFNHVQPFEFNLGQGGVIKGWDEGIALLNKGAKATLYIPSAMAYGASSPSKLIPENSVLVFDVELVNF